jgi:hypothetical protein
MNPFDRLTADALAKIAELIQQGDLHGAAHTIEETLAENDRLAAAFRDERAKLHDHRVRRLLEGIGSQAMKRD